MIQAFDRGYNPETGAPYGEAATDGGHKKPHSLYPELSKAPDNIMPENAYENRTKGAAETSQEEAERLATGLIKKNHCRSPGSTVLSSSTSRNGSRS